MYLGLAGRMQSAIGMGLIKAIGFWNWKGEGVSCLIRRERGQSSFALAGRNGLAETLLPSQQKFPSCLGLVSYENLSCLSAQGPTGPVSAF